jgi:cephalosporin hydroxylase
MLDSLGGGRVVSVDINPQAGVPEHPRIEYLEGSSVSPSILERIQARCDDAQSVLVILDSDHKADYKLQELRAYAGFVTPGSYLIAEDTTFDYFPAWPEYGPGPWSAVREFMNGDTQFETDRGQERHLVTFAPAAFLRRKSPSVHDKDG